MFHPSNFPGIYHRNNIWCVGCVFNQQFEVYLDDIIIYLFPTNFKSVGKHMQTETKIDIVKLNLILVTVQHSNILFNHFIS